MSFSNSKTVKIALSNPVEKFGKRYNISNIYLPDSSYEQSLNSEFEKYGYSSSFHQNIDGKAIDLKLEIQDPRDSHIIKTTEEIYKNPYISGINVSVYENSGDAEGIKVLAKRTKIFETGIKDIAFNYLVTGETEIRNYSVDFELVDFAGNQSSSLFTTRNLEPNFIIGEHGIENGFYNINYSGATDEDNNDTSNGLQYITAYNFTGLNSGTSGVFSQEENYISQNINIENGEYGNLKIELSPGDKNYIMALGVDGFGTGHQKGIYQARQYVTGQGFSGISGDPKAPKVINYYPEINSINSKRISGGDAIYFSFETNYNTESNLLKTCYGITGTGESSEAVSGYSGHLFLESGLFFANNELYEYGQTGKDLIFDNSLVLQNGLNTGTAIDSAIVSGIDFTGSGIYGSGAGYLWADQCPRYTGYEYQSGDSFYGGDYYYSYFNSENGVFDCASYGEITSGTHNVTGIYSMPVNNPNSYDIKYRTGPNFSKTYEQASSYLNAIGEMPAVIINNFQLKKIQQMNSGLGWVGLRRNKVGVLQNIFSENFLNQAFFDGTNFLEESQKFVQAINSSGQLENSRIAINDVGNNWAWVNSSGTHIYKYAGSGYEKVREAYLSVDIDRKRDDQNLFHVDYTGQVPFVEVNDVQFTLLDGSLEFKYTFENGYYSQSYEKDIDADNYDLIALDLFTGSNPSFIADQSSYMQSYSFGYDDRSGIVMDSYDLQTGFFVDFNDITEIPKYYKMLTYDTVGSGFLVDINESVGNIEIKPEINHQVSIVNLDEARNQNTNCIDLQFKYNHKTTPIVTFGLSYTGTKDDISYLGAMIKGSPTISNVEFILTEVPPDTGYCLYVNSHNS